MLSKIIRPDSFDFDVPVAKLVEAHSKGVDKGWLMKRAAMFDDKIADLKPEKNHSLIHVITTGAMETYGPNSNCDGFNRSKRTYTVPMPKNASEAVIELDGGLDKYHGTYMEKGAVYKNHKDNKNPENASGKIVHECINDDLNRGELIISVDNDKWHDEIEKLANDQDVYLSQGCGVKYDVCSACGHKRKSFKDSCDHIKMHKLAILEDGHQVFVINDAPHFHDISGVVKPADKIAFALRKVASGEIITSTELAELEGYTAPSSLADNLYGKVFDKYSKLVKLAELEKEIIAVGDDCATDAFTEESGFKGMEGSACDCIKNDTGRSLGLMHGSKIVLPVELFIKLLGGDNLENAEDIIPEVKGRMPSLFSDMLESDDLEDILKDGTYDGIPGVHGHIKPLFDKMLGDHSVAFGPVKKRVTITTIMAKPGEKPQGITIKKEASENSNADYLAREYGKYLLSFNRKCDDEFAERMSVLQKFV
jgi:hypothetical protein